MKPALAAILFLALTGTAAAQVSDVEVPNLVLETGDATPQCIENAVENQRRRSFDVGEMVAGRDSQHQ